MVVRITYFVHGTTIDNEKGVSSGWSDAGLSASGVRQSKALGAIIDREFSAVFCSDLKRAVDSAQLTFDGKFKIIQDSRLRECNYGDYNGKPSDIVEPMQEGHIIERFPNGESYEDVEKRVKDFVDFLKKNYDGKSVAIVSHKAPQLALEVLLNGKSWENAFSEDWRKRNAIVINAAV